MMTNEQMAASDEMVRGYLDGFDDERDELPESSNYSQQYRHGWNNGRDDRKHNPRSSYNALVSEAKRLIEGDL